MKMQIKKMLHDLTEDEFNQVKKYTNSFDCDIEDCKNCQFDISFKDRSHTVCIGSESLFAFKDIPLYNNKLIEINEKPECKLVQLRIEFAVDPIEVFISEAERLNKTIVVEHNGEIRGIIAYADSSRIESKLCLQNFSHSVTYQSSYVLIKDNSQYSYFYENNGKRIYCGKTISQYGIYIDDELINNCADVDKFLEERRQCVLIKTYMGIGIIEKTSEGKYQINSGLNNTGGFVSDSFYELYVKAIEDKCTFWVEKE